MAVAGGIFHDRAAEQGTVGATSERDGACGFALGGFGLRSHTNRGANHHCSRNYSGDCHVVPLVGPAAGGLTSKTGKIDVAQPKNYTGRDAHKGIGPRSNSFDLSFSNSV